MKKINSFIALCSILFIGTMAQAQEWIYPVIKEYGKIKYYEDAELIPDKDTDYKIVFNLDADKEREGVNAGLWKMARTINLLGASGVPKEHIHLVGVIHGKATPAVLSEAAHQKRMQKANPNLELLKVLRENDVKIYVCGQSLAQLDIDPKTEMNEYITLSLSALIDIPYFQLKGYALIP